MRELTGNQVRQMFLDFFKSKQHMIEPGASLVPHNDPTLLWINAGVAALKKYFDGSEQPMSNRIANAQKSIRTNDIENVGKTARHHTFFEMLGNFSIGDYFKEDAIAYAWEFLTSPQWIGFPKDKLYISVYQEDQDAYRIWTKTCGVSPSHILKSDDNFWEIGEGPGGPNSEIFYDRGEKYDPDGIGEALFFEEMDNDRYIEVWNIVFSQYNCKPSQKRSEYEELPQKNIDTGMGLERLVCLVQGGETNFDTDLFFPLLHACEAFTPFRYEQIEYQMAFRVIVDHIRTLTFALADGALFSNEGRGYVLRRILRRGARYGKKLGIKGAFMYKLVPVVYECMGTFYPYLKEKLDTIASLIQKEEKRFQATLADGEKLLLEVMKKCQESKTIDGVTAFKLYDTYGFPLELTMEMAQEEGYHVDQAGFDEEMKLQKQRARSARENNESMSSQSHDLMSFTQKSTFIGYDAYTCHARVIAMFKDGVFINELDEEGDVIFDQTVFYAESGGQVGDQGGIHGDGIDGKILTTSKTLHKQHLHHIRLRQGRLQMGDQVVLQVDVERRHKITCNHSCTHLLQSALRHVVGDHIQQAGSFVNDAYARFDFTHFTKVNDVQLQEIEQLVNTYIQAHYPVLKEEMSLAAAKQSGAIALFDEKYGDVVRVVSMGDVSKEFCGGCHVANTQEIGLCYIVGEESIGSGVRRIIAKTGYAAYMEFAQNKRGMHAIAQRLKMNNTQQLEDKVGQLMEENTMLKKERAQMQNKLFVAKAKDMEEKMVHLHQHSVLMERMDGMDGKALKDIVLQLKSAHADSVIFLASVQEKGILFVAGAGSQAVADGIHCGNLVKEAAAICGGKGGGRPDLAQSGGKDVAKISDAMAFVKNMLS